MRHIQCTRYPLSLTPYSLSPIPYHLPLIAWQVRAAHVDEKNTDLLYGFGDETFGGVHPGEV